MTQQESDSADPCVRLFHASLVWPLQIEPQPGKPIYIQTIRHAGYVLYAEPL